MMTGLTRSFRRRIEAIVGPMPLFGRSRSRSGIFRPGLRPFFPLSRSADGPLKCAACGSESPPGSNRCKSCHRSLRIDSDEALFPAWFVLVLMLGTGLASFWLGREIGREPGPRPGAPRVESGSAADTGPTTSPESDPPDPSDTELPASDSGPTWAIFTSQDRLTNRPLFGARFGNASGNQLFSVLCTEDRAALALRRGLLPASDGASGDGNGIVATINVGARVAAREGGRVEVTFDVGPPELVDIYPKRPVEFLRRAASSRRIQTTADVFDPKDWARAIERVLNACGFEKRPGLATSPARSRD